jgi:hypothetical protein
MLSNKKPQKNSAASHIFDAKIDSDLIYFLILTKTLKFARSGAQNLNRLKRNPSATCNKFLPIPVRY